MNTLTKYLLSAIVILTILVILLFFRGKQVEVIERRFVDTLTVVKVDTIVKYRTKYITERVVDTVYISNADSNIALPKVQRHFREESIYDAWVSGIDPLIDSIKVYPKTEYKTITNNTVKEVSPLTWKIYLNGGFQAISGDFAPCVGVTLATPRNWLISANIGILKKEPLYGFSVSYKIFDK